MNRRALKMLLRSGRFLCFDCRGPYQMIKERNAAEDMLINHMHVMATASIARQENPRRLEMLLNTILPPSERVDYFG